MSKETITFSIDGELKTELKVKAAKQNITVTEILTNLIQEYVYEK